MAKGKRSSWSTSSPQECHIHLLTPIIGPYSPAISSSKTIFNFSSSFQGPQEPSERTLTNSINPLALHGPDLGLGASYENSPVPPPSPSAFAPAVACGSSAPQGLSAAQRRGPSDLCGNLHLMKTKKDAAVLCSPLGAPSNALRSEYKYRPRRAQLCLPTQGQFGAPQT